MNRHEEASWVLAMSFLHVGAGDRVCSVANSEQMKTTTAREQVEKHGSGIRVPVF